MPRPGSTALRPPQEQAWVVWEHEWPGEGGILPWGLQDLWALRLHLSWQGLHEEESTWCQRECGEKDRGDQDLFNTAELIHGALVVLHAVLSQVQVSRVLRRHKR